MVSFLILTIIWIYQVSSETVQCTNSNTCRCQTPGLCQLYCSNPSDCQNTDLYCYPNYPCKIYCTKPSTCSLSTIHDNQATDISLICSGPDSCQGSLTELNCGSNSCALNCAKNTACIDLTINTNNAKSFQCIGNCPSNVPDNYTSMPTYTPTKNPSVSPTMIPTIFPTNNPTYYSISPTLLSTVLPTNILTISPTILPTNTPTILPTNMPTFLPSIITTNSESTRSESTKISELTATETETETVTAATNRSDSDEIISINPTDTLKIYYSDKKLPTDTNQNNIFTAVNISLCTVGLLSICCIGFILYNVIKKKQRARKLKQIFDFDPNQIEMNNIKPDAVTPSYINQNISQEKSVSEFVMTVVQTAGRVDSGENNKPEGECDMIMNATNRNGITAMDDSDTEIDDHDVLYNRGNGNNRTPNGNENVDSESDS